MEEALRDGERLGREVERGEKELRALAGERGQKYVLREHELTMKISQL